MKLSSFRNTRLRAAVVALAMAGMVTLGAPNASAAFIDTQQTVSIVAAGGYYQELIYNYTTTALSVTDAINFDADVLYELPTGQWIGIFHYDYSASAFTEAVYTYNDVF